MTTRDISQSMLSGKCPEVAASKPFGAILVNRLHTGKPESATLVQGQIKGHEPQKGVGATALTDMHSVTITFAQRREKEEIQTFLRDYLVSLINDIQKTIYEESDMTTSVVVLFSNSSKATRALEELKKCQMECSVQLKCMDNTKEVVYEKDIEYIERKLEQSRRDHEIKVNGLHSDLQRLQSNKKFIPLEEYEKLSKEREVLKAKIGECEEQKEEFEKYVQPQLSCLSSPSPSMLTKVTKNLLRECTRFSTALPIYCRRSEIVDTVCESSVTVLVGETGSGKSTQVVQYLYEAGFAEDGLIVCTQPRKVAAISITKHVSNEMQLKLGEELGYRVGMNEKCSARTKIVFMTDHMLLNECIADHTLSKYTCVLIDEAHERSINTDMLLAFLKQCLSFRPDLKVIIMSATIEPELFVKYFQDAVKTIKVSGRTFPVEVVYDPLQTRHSLSAEGNYVMNAVDVAKIVHNEHPQGDILVFLTCAPEIEKACKAMECLSFQATILPLHGKLPPEEQQKVFESGGTKRKIIFSTNVAETSVTIPGVKYVVDTGLAKEMHFDTKRCMDSLEVRHISKSSAEQRKGRAGRLSAGKCYRLYTSEDYSSMPNRAKPEILRIQLSQVVLKIMEFGVPNVLTFDFVEHPDYVALETAVKTLEFVGAIHENMLTGTGGKMAALPLKPQLSKVLLDGIEIGLGTEALISVALSSLAGQVFFRSGTDEMKQCSDKKKLAFCHPMGDQMTSLTVYQCWQTQRREQRTKWCLENYVNAKSMRIIEEMVNELSYILKKKLKLNVNHTLKSLEMAECYLCKLYFDAFILNLAVFLGHEKVGYLTISAEPDTSSYTIFPGSSMAYQNTTPKYVMYENTLKTSRQFLTQVMHVKQEWVDEAVRMGRLDEDPAEKFADIFVSPLHVLTTGPQIYYELVKKRKELAQVVDLNSLPNSISPVLDFSTTPKQWGVVRVLAQKHCHNTVKFAVTQLASELRAKLIEETKEYGLTSEYDLTRVVMGVGGVVQRVIMPNQFRSLTAVCCDKRQSLDDVEVLLQKYGEVCAVKKHPENAQFSITYSSTESAQKALNEFSFPNVELYPYNCQQFTLQLQWERRERAAFAFLLFENHEDCQSVLQYGMISYQLNRIKISKDKYGNPSKLFLTGNVLSLCDEDNLRDVICNKVGENIQFSLKMGYKKFETKQLLSECEEYLSDDSDSHERDMNYDLRSEELRIQSIIKEKIENKYAKEGTYTVKFIHPMQWHIYFTAYVTFYESEMGYKVLHSDWNGECIDGKTLSVRPHFKRVVSIRKDIYSLVYEDIENTRKILIHRYPRLYIKILQPERNMKDFSRISISTSDVRTFSVAQNMIHEAAKPCVLNCDTTELQEYVVNRTCSEELKAIQKSTSTYVYRDLNTMCFKIYGIDQNQDAAVSMIKDKAQELFSDGATTYEINLRDSKWSPGLMKCLVTKYGYELDGMLDFEGVRRITLNPHLQLISLLATTKGVGSVKACLDQLSMPLCVQKLESEYEFNCSACFTLIEDPKGLVRLESCGHPFHIECIKVQLKSDTLTFPVQCAQDGCGIKLVLKDFYNLQKRLIKFSLADLMPMALQKFMIENKDVYKNCPSPDCKMIYVKTDDSREFVCNSCFFSTCTKCHEQYHPGINCEMYKINKQSDEQLYQWMEEDPENRKTCPKCATPIEKNAGCMHMKCMCGIHLCWMCMKCFRTADDCYDHQPYCPVYTPPPARAYNPIAICHQRNNPPRINPAPAVHTPVMVADPIAPVVHTPVVVVDPAYNPAPAVRTPVVVADPVYNPAPAVHTPVMVADPVAPAVHTPVVVVDPVYNPAPAVRTPVVVADPVYNPAPAVHTPVMVADPVAPAVHTPVVVVDPVYNPAPAVHTPVVVADPVHYSATAVRNAAQRVNITTRAFHEHVRAQAVRNTPQRNDRGGRQDSSCTIL